MQYQHIPGGYIYNLQLFYSMCRWLFWIWIFKCFVAFLFVAFDTLFYGSLFMFFCDFYSSKQRKWKMNQCTREDQWNKQGIMFQCFYLKHKIFNIFLLSLWSLIRKIIGVDIHYEHCHNKRIFYWWTGVMFQYLIVNKT